jgi:pimeloyl-ACP methyl ester carboxylesterase
MRCQEFRIDVTGRSDLPGAQSTVATVYMPDRLAVPATVLFAFPGAGLNRHYFDITAEPGYSQAQSHVSDGFIFISCDHLGTADSTHPNPDALDYQNLAAANHATATTLVDGLRRGSLVSGLPPIDIDKVVGIGQAMGACLLTVQQARHQSFDAVALLGWSAIATSSPVPDASDERVETELFSRYPATGTDEGPRAPWRSTTVPTCAVTMFRPRIVAAEAAAITVPVLLASGERDAVPDPWAEPSAYRSSRLVAVAVIDDMAQLHNLSANRNTLWDHITDFACVVRPRLKALV